jgi:dienelactone hydrolase
MHGLSGSKSNWLEDGFTHGSLVAQGLLNKGYAVMALDAQFHGDRAVYNDYINPGDMVFKFGWTIRYKDLLTQSVIDYRRAIDYLGTRHEIDTSRIGMLGYSMGGQMTFLLAASDPRIKTIVACVVPVTKGSMVEASTFVRSLNKKPLLMMMARKDKFYTVDSAQALFDSIPGDNKTLRFYDSGHSLPPSYAGEAITWIDNHL